jgi:hypothetical protein
MTVSKSLSQFLIFAMVAILLLFLTGVSIEAADNSEPDQALIKASFKKASELKHNAIPLYVKSKEGNIIITGGAMVSIGNNKFGLAENDMAVNVGEFPIKVGGFTLLKGEYVVVKTGKIVKQPGKITAN